MLSPARRSAKKSQRSGWTIADRQAVRPLPAWPSSRNVLRNHSAFSSPGSTPGFTPGAGSSTKPAARASAVLRACKPQDRPLPD